MSKECEMNRDTLAIIYKDIPEVINVALKKVLILPHRNKRLLQWHMDSQSHYQECIFFPETRV
jgi:hypothetical protein